MRPLLLCTIVAAFTATLSTSRAQERSDSVGTGTLNVFLDCNACDNDYVRQTVTFVNYVRDRTLADVHLLVTTEDTGAGRRYTLDFIGLRSMTGMRDTLRVNTSVTDTSDERRSAVTRAVALGLVRYAAQTPLADEINVVYVGGADASPEQPQNDPWNSWIFSLGVDGFFESEESQDFLFLGGEAEANRVTNDWKLSFELDGSYRRSQFDLSDTTIVNTTRNGSLWTLVARSLGPHWSAGSSTYLNTSSFNNVDIELSFAPAIEYSVFPYSDFNRREFRIEYRVGATFLDYEEVTIFDKRYERLLFHELEGTFELTQPWGSAEVDLEFYQYLHDFEQVRTELYRAELGGELDLRIVRGLSFSIGSSISWVRDQISLPAEEASEEEIFLESRRLATDYEYGMSIGLSYTFGSIYNNVVNPRFGF